MHLIWVNKTHCKLAWTFLGPLILANQTVRAVDSLQFAFKCCGFAHNYLVCRWVSNPAGEQSMRIDSFRSINTHIVTKRKKWHLNKYLTRRPVRFGYHNIFCVCVQLCNYVNSGSNKFRTSTKYWFRSEVTCYIRLCVFSSPFFIMMIARMRVIHFIMILKSKVWPIFYLGLDHDTMVCAVCFSIL